MDTDTEPQTADEIMAAMDAVIASADGEERNLTDEEIARYEELETRLQATKSHTELIKRHAAYKTAVTPTITPGHESTRKDDTLERAFSSYLRTGKENADLLELRSQSEGTGSEGGYLVPDGFRQKLVDRMKAFGGVANVVENVVTSDGRTLPWATIDDTANEGEIVDEGGTFVSGADLVFGTASLGAYSYMAGGAGSTPLRLSRELVQDAAFDTEKIVSDKLGQRLGRIQARHLVTGDGVKKPLGLITGLTGVQITHTGVKYADLLKVIHAVDPAYRDGGNCRWAFNDNSWATIQGLLDSNGDPLWRPNSANMGTSAEGGSNLMLLNYPVTIDQAFPDINLADNTVNWGTFGDLYEGYVRRAVRDIEILVNPYSRMNYREIEYTAWARMDGTQQNTSAYTAITAATS
jgi:HK97 family phage major capsid protein